MFPNWLSHLRKWLNTVSLGLELSSFPTRYGRWQGNVLRATLCTSGQRRRKIGPAVKLPRFLFWNYWPPWKACRHKDAWSNLPTFQLRVQELPKNSKQLPASRVGLEELLADNFRWTVAHTMLSTWHVYLLKIQDSVCICDGVAAAFQGLENAIAGFL